MAKFEDFPSILEALEELEYLLKLYGPKSGARYVLTIHYLNTARLLEQLDAKQENLREYAAKIRNLAAIAQGDEEWNDEEDLDSMYPF